MSMILEDRPQNGLGNSGRRGTGSNTIWPLFRDYFDYYFNETKYNRNKKQSISVGVFWLLIFIVCALLCVIFISQLWMKWSLTSLAIMNADTLAHVHEIPFPAVTVCLETKSMSSKYNFTENYHLYDNSSTRAKMSDHDRDIFEDLTLVCDKHLSSATGRNFSDPTDVLFNLKKVGPDVAQAFFVCKWKYELTQECAELFSTILTEEGICFTFNMLGTDDVFKTENLHSEYRYINHENESQSKSFWSFETGYSSTAGKDTYPRRGSGYGGNMGLTFLINQNKMDLDYLCRGPVQGSRVLLHNPAEFPRMDSQYFRTAVNEESVMLVKPKMITTSAALRSYPPERRQCYFSQERYLHYFKVYTQSNCEYECLTNYTYARCGCVHIGMPRGPDMKVCNTGKVECMNQARNKFMESELDAPFGQEEAAHRCNCLPSCTSIEYESEISQADYDFEALCKAYKVGLGDGVNENLLMSRIKVFFKSSQFIASQRRELYGAIDFLADCGGIVGLFVGVSLLSLVKLIYIVASRVYFELQMKNKGDDGNHYESVDAISGVSI